jgi:ACS family hexuronate transporter-like MFS transporter
MKASAALSGGRPARSHMRWIIVALLFWVTTSNYIDRGIFGNLAPEMPKYLRLADKVKPSDIDQYWKEHAKDVLAVHAKHLRPEGDAQNCEQCQAFMKDKIVKASWDESYWNMGVAFSAAYAISMLLMGRLMDVVGLRWGFAFACGFWTLASMLHAIAPEIGGLFGNPITGFFICRILLGLGEGGNFPAAVKTIAEWFPKSERALATGFLNCGSNFGGMFVPWVLPFILVQFSALTIAGVTIGWRGAFIITAVIDIGWIIVWLAFYRDPEKHLRVSQVELAHIQGGAAEPTTKIPWRKLLPHKQTWAFVCAKFLTDGFWWFYLFGSPDFFNKRFNLGPEDRKYQLMLIYIIADVGAIAGGWLSGRFMNRGWTVSRARKMTLLICALMVVPVFYSALTDNKWVAAILITLAASGHQAWSSNVFSLAGDMFPKRIVGSLTGFAGMCSTIASMALFFVTGKVLKFTGNYLPIFILASLAYPLALLIVHLMAPKLEPANIEEPEVALSYSK